MMMTQYNHNYIGIHFSSIIILCPVIIQYNPFLLEVQTDEQFDLSKPEGSEPGKRFYVLYCFYCVLLVCVLRTCLLIITFHECIGTFPVSTEKLEKMKTKIKQRCSDKPNAQGIAFLIGFPDGNDVQDLSSTFENDLSFTVWSKREITCAKLACLVKAAVKVQYPPTYKYIVFYYAGHVGVNKSNRPFLVPVQPEANNEAEVLDINENILSPFNSKKNRPSCLFFFDCITPAEMSKVCESDDPCDSMKPVAPQEKILNLNAPVRCLVAYYATSVLQGEPIQRIWSQTLCKNLKEKYLSISRILDLTHDTIKDAGLTSPHYESFVGSVYLNGMNI